MGSKTWVLMSYNDNVSDKLSTAPSLDREKTDHYVNSIFPKHNPVAAGTTTLQFAAANGRDVLAACYDDIFIISCKELAIDSPSQLPLHLRPVEYGKNQCLICLHSVVDWFAMAVWESGELLRAISVSPDSEVIEDIGTKFPFEEPYWKGENSPIDPEDEEDTYPLPFHPLELGEEALLNRFGYQLEGYPDHWKFDPEEIPLIRYSRPKSQWWRFW